MSLAVRRSAALAFLVFSVACGSSGPTSPTTTNQPSTLPPTPPPTPPPTQILPPLEGPSRTFIFDAELTDRLWSTNRYFASSPRDYTRNSLFVLYDNGAVVLQIPPSSLSSGRLRGQYRDVNGVLMFLLGERRSIFEPWDDAVGTLRGDSLTIQYKESMHHADFEDAVYVLKPM
jgi:hypothetical protein